MGCPNSKSSENVEDDEADRIISSQGRAASTRSSAPAQFDGRAKPNLQNSSEETIVQQPPPERSAPAASPQQISGPAPAATGSLASENYISMKGMIIDNPAGVPFSLDADVVEARLEEIREELEGHNNENVTEGEKEYFIEQRCWDTYYPEHSELFMGQRPKSAIRPKAPITSCNGCNNLGQSIRRCPWIVLTSCPIFDHDKYNVRFGDEIFTPCRQCQSAESQGSRS